MSIVLALAVGSGACSCQPGGSNVVPKNKFMNSTPNTEPNSIVRRSTHILLVKVINATAGTWVPSSPGLKSRTVKLSLQITQTLRGTLNPPPIEPVHTTITASDYAGELMMQPVTGVWSGVELAPGTDLVIFAQSTSLRIEHVLTEPACTRVVPADSVLHGLRIAVKAEAERLSLDRTLALAIPEATWLDPTFADFLWDQYGAGATASQADFALLAGFAEGKDINTTTRNALLDGGYTLVKLHGDATPERAQRLALAMCRVLLMGEATDLHENLIGTYLPNLLGITSGLPLQPASTVFKGHEAERDALAAFLRQHGTHADAAPLKSWLNVK